MYIGNDLQVAESGNKIIDDISSSFNGSTTSFALLVGGAAPVPFPINTQQIYISVNGVIQEPDPTGSAGFKLLGNNIVFSSAPANGHAFFGVILSGADYVTVGTEFPAGSATSPSVTWSTDNDSGFYSVTGGTVGFTSDGVQTFTLDGNGFNLPDNKKLFLGSSSDLEIYHDGSHSRIHDNGTGKLILAGDEINLNNAGSTEYCLRTLENGAVELYYDNTKRFETSNTGTNVTGVHVDDGATHDGDVTFTGAAANVTWDKSEDDLIFNDNAKAAFGTGSDLTIFHDGSNSYIKDVGTGNLLIDQSTANVLYLRSDDLRLSSYTGTETYIDCNVNGAVELYHNNVKTFNTESWGNTSHGQIFKVLAGEGIDATLQLVCDDGDDNADLWQIFADASHGGLNIQNYASGSYETNIATYGNGSVELYYDNTKRFETVSDGIRWTGHCYANDNYKLRLGTGEDLQIYHDGSHAYQLNSTNYSYYGATQHHFVNAANNEVQAKFLENGAVELYHDNIKTLETTATGCTIQKTASNQNADLVIDSTNGGQARLYLKTSLSGTNRAARIDFSNQGSEQWTIINDYDQDGTNVLSVRHGAEIAIACDPDGAVELYNNNVKKLETTSAGVQFTGTEVKGPDNCKFVAGTSGDADFFHDGSATYLRNQTGDLCIRSNNNILFQPFSADELFAKFIDDGACEFYHDNTIAFKTLSGGGLDLYGHIVGGDNRIIKLGGGADLQIYHDGNNSYIDDTGTGSLILKSSRVSFNDTSNNENARLDTDGLKFNGDSAAANALDDYEEGTFTPAFRVEGQSSNVSTDTQEGKYTKIGNVCTLWIYIVLDGSPSGTGSGNAWEIRNIPFTSVSDTDHQAVGNARCHNLNNGYYGSDIQMIPRIWNSTTVGRLEAYDQSDYTIRNASTYMQDNTGAMITITYCCA